jgi:sugar lactone lactonase YvrE
MRDWRPLFLWLSAAGCGNSAQPTAARCTGACTTATTLTTLDLLAGQPGGPGWVDGALVAAHLADPWAIASDGSGHLYVIDGNTVRAIDIAAGQMTTLAGAFGQVGGADGTGPRASFNQPSGLVWTGSSLVISDTENNDIRRIDVATAAVQIIAGASGQTGTADAVGLDARFNEPEGLALDTSGNLFIADTNNDTIRVLALDGSAVTTVAGLPSAGGTADGVGPAAEFNTPRALAFDSAGTLYVADSINQSIRKLDPATNAVSTLTTFGTPPQGPVPQGVALDGSDVLVSLAGGGALVESRIVRVTPDGAVTTVAGSDSAQGFVDAVGTDARFNGPAGLFNDGAGTLYVADEHNAVIRAVDLATTAVRTYAGARSSGSADGTGGQARFLGPEGLAASDRTVYVADTGNDTIRAIDLATGEVTTIAGAVGQPGSTDGAPGDARFDHPQGLALDDGAQALYVADTQNRRIRRVDLAAGTVTTLVYTPAPGDTFGGFDAPSGLALDAGRLFVTDYTDDAVVAVDLQKGEVSTLAGHFGSPGRADGIGAAAAFYGPLGIAADGGGHLYVADDLNETIRAIDIATATVSTLAGQPVIGGSSDGAGAAAHFHYPFDIATDGKGSLFVSDSFNNTVRRIDVATGTVTTVIGTVSPSGVRLGALPAQLSQPSALALTSAGGLLLVSENAVLLAH